jgi:hypothetical protein
MTLDPPSPAPGCCPTVLQAEGVSIASDVPEQQCDSGDRATAPQALTPIAGGSAKPLLPQFQDGNSQPAHGTEAQTATMAAGPSQDGLLMPPFSPPSSNASVGPDPSIDALSLGSTVSPQISPGGEGVSNSSLGNSPPSLMCNALPLEVVRPGPEASGVGNARTGVQQPEEDRPSGRALNALLDPAGQRTVDMLATACGDAFDLQVTQCQTPPCQCLVVCLLYRNMEGLLEGEGEV